MNSLSYQNAIDLLNKNLELYLQNKCDPAVANLSKAMTQLTLQLEQENKEHQRALQKILAALQKP